MTTWGEHSLDGAASFVVLLAAGLRLRAGHRAGQHRAARRDRRRTCTAAPVRWPSSPGPSACSPGLSLLTAVALRRFTAEVHAIGTPFELCPPDPRRLPGLRRGDRRRHPHPAAHRLRRCRDRRRARSSRRRGAAPVAWRRTRARSHAVLVSPRAERRADRPTGRRDRVLRVWSASTGTGTAPIARPTAGLTAAWQIPTRPTRGSPSRAAARDSPRCRHVPGRGRAAGAGHAGAPVLGDDLPLIDDRVTVEHLLAHRSGIGDYLDEDADRDVTDYVLPVPVHQLADTEATCGARRPPAEVRAGRALLLLQRRLRRPRADRRAGRRRRRSTTRASSGSARRPA